MSKITRITFLIGSITLSVGILMFFYALREPSLQIEAYRGDSFYIPHNCKHLGLLGCTPHPTSYLKKNGNNPELLKTITLKDFLDIEYLRDSFDRTFLICKEQNIDHLIIAYLPVYYVGMRALAGDQFISSCNLFFKRIIPEIMVMIKEASLKAEFGGHITLIVPPRYQLAHVPFELTGIDDRIRYLIKQFPKLKNMSESLLQTITIINNKESLEDDMLINYLKYKYLYEKPIIYRKCNIGKERFHRENQSK